MEKSAFFNNKLLPYLLLVPQLVITFVFFYWPASQALWQSFLREDAFGLYSEFIGLENYQALLAEPHYYKAMLTTVVFSTLVAALSLSIALLFATQADKNLKAAPAYKTFMIWPYAVAPAVAGVLWTFMFPLLSPTTFFLLVVNVVYVFFDTFGIIDAVTGGGPAGATTTMVYKVYADGRLGGDLGGSAAQSVVLMVIVIALTAIQFRYVERRVQY